MPVRAARDVPAKHVCLSSILNGISSYSLQAKHLQPSLWPIGPAWSGRCPCLDGDHRYESGMGRLHKTVWYANG
jgi:hypothetical protein